ncbi:hypothetical protein PVAP13_3KG041469 [Panicum virgatum]|uniref:Uncharacterized protein n=1 Tax=Panicum virgatum TaxID=38727 RepID=A0A8T0ULR8_PANVG|nr:hypothetical protein PVAP13_3KG041469 [Panicum virgatum]
MRIKAAASERLSAIVSGVDPHPLPLAINGAARRRSEAAHARRRKTSEHGAHHVARAAPAARAGSEDVAAVRVHRRRIDQGDTALRSFVPGGGQGRDVRSSSLSRDNSMPWARGMELRGAAVGRTPTIIRILRLSLLAEERMRAPTPCFPFSASASASASPSPYGRCVQSVICCFLV